MEQGATFNINSKLLFGVNKFIFWGLCLSFFVSPISLMLGAILGYLILIIVENSNIKEEYFLYFCGFLFWLCLVFEVLFYKIHNHIFYVYTVLDFLKSCFGTSFKTVYTMVDYYGGFGTLMRLLCSFLLIDYGFPQHRNFVAFFDWFFSSRNYLFITMNSLLVIFFNLILPASKKELRNKVANSNVEISEKNYLKIRDKATNFGGKLQGDSSVNIGVDIYHKEHSILFDYVKTHVLILGTTGGGKTVTMFNFIEQAIQNNIPVIIIDGKGSRDLITAVKSCTDYFQRNFKLFSLSNSAEFDKTCYNPFAVGLATEHKEKLLELVNSDSSSAGADYYRNIDAGLVQFVFSLMIATEEFVDMYSFSKCLNAGKVTELIQELAKIMEDKNNDESKTIHENLLAQYATFQTVLLDDKLSGIKQVVNNFVYSQVGHLFDTRNKKNVINLHQDCIENDSVVLFSLSAGGFPDFVRRLGELILIDCNSVAAKVETTIGKKTVAIIADEFTAISSSAIRQTLSRNRSAGMYCVLGSQSLGVIEAEDKALAKDIEANHGITIAHVQASAKDAEELAKNIGTIKSKQVTAQIGETGSTGTGSFRETREFLVHPDEIKKLRTGEAYLYSIHDFECTKIVARKSRFLDTP